MVFITFLNNLSIDCLNILYYLINLQQVFILKIINLIKKLKTNQIIKMMKNKIQYYYN